MKTTKLLMNHHQHTNKGVVVHKTGETVTLPDDEVNYIHRAVISKRKRIREKASAMPGTSEWKRDR